MAWTYKEGWHFTMRLSVVLTSSVYRWPLVFIVNLTGVAHTSWVCEREGVSRDNQIWSECVWERASAKMVRFWVCVWERASPETASLRRVCVWERGHLQRQSGLGWVCVCERHRQRWSGLECVWERSLQRQSALEWVCVWERASPEMISSWTL